MAIRMSGLGAFLALILIVFSATASAQQQDNNSGSPAASDESQVMQSFTSQEDVESGLVSIDDKRKRQIMFAMGIPLRCLS
jgi:hypothetical protein